MVFSTFWVLSKNRTGVRENPLFLKLVNFLVSSDVPAIFFLKNSLVCFEVVIAVFSICSVRKFRVLGLFFNFGTSKKPWCLCE